MRKTELERFWEKVEKTETCWNWTAALTGMGYSQFWYAGKVRPAHRYSYELAKGPIPEGMVIDHICHNPACVNPEHLRATTHKQNMEHKLGAQKNSKTGVLGVYWHKRRRTWNATICHNGVREHIGSFDRLEDAEAAVVAKRNELFTHNDHDRKAA